MNICGERYEGSDTQTHACQRPEGHAHGHDSSPLSDGYYCMLHRCDGDHR